MENLNFKVMMLMACILCMFQTFAQKPALTISDVKIKKETVVTVPVKTTDFNNVCAIGLKIFYDTTKLKFIECNSVNAKIKAAISNAYKGMFAIAWASADGYTPVKIGNDLLFNMKFQIKDNKFQTLNLDFNTNESIISDCDLQKVKITYNNGKISH